MWADGLSWVGRLYLWATHRLYNEFAWAYDFVSWLVSLGQWASWRQLALDHLRGQRILEVGFGTGELMIAMAERSLHVYGLEPSQAMQWITANKLRRREVSVPRVAGIAQKLPFADGSFDSVIATFPAEYILDPATLGEVARVLRDPDPAKGIRGGRFIVVGMGSSPNSRPLRFASRVFSDERSESIRGRYERMARAAGMSVTMVGQEGKVAGMSVVISEKCGS